MAAVSPSMSATLTSAPFSRNRRAAVAESAFAESAGAPYSDTRSSGVCPSSSAVVTSAPASSSRFTCVEIRQDLRLRDTRASSAVCPSSSAVRRLCARIQQRVHLCSTCHAHCIQVLTDEQTELPCTFRGVTHVITHTHTHGKRLCAEAQ
eukprot:4718427-Pyramimonas_sp.AAC.1